MKNPVAGMWLGLVTTFVLIALAVFLSAGTFHYWQAWLYLGVGVVSSVLLTFYIVKDQALLGRRTKFGPASEQLPAQKIIVVFTGLPAIGAFIVPGLDRRFGWSSVPPWLSIVGEILVIVSIRIVYLVFRENSFGSATVEVSADQKVISTGPYSVVRNPMYASAAVYFVGLSLALGSYWGLIAAFLTVLGFVWRLLDEEKFLGKNLPGYEDYCARVHWHLIPGIF